MQTLGHFFEPLYIHSICVFCLWRGGKGLEGLGGPYTKLSNLVSPIPLVLEVSGLGVPLVNFCRECQGT